MVCDYQLEPKVCDVKAHASQCAAASLSAADTSLHVPPMQLAGAGDGSMH